MTAQAETGALAPVAQRVTVTIDGFEITVPKGMLVIRAAELLGIQIPRFCDHPLLDPVGACRQCLVEVEGQAKPLASCTTTCTDGMKVRTQLTSQVADKAQARGDGDAAHQPPARLPHVRQGRRVPAAEPGHVQRPGRVAVHRGQAHLRQAGGAVHRGAAGPGALCLLRALHQVRRADRRGPAHRTAGARPGSAGRHRGRGAVRLLLLRQHRADLPGRRADRGRLPVPRAAVRPGVHAQHLRALRVRVPAAHRSPARHGDPPPGGQRPAGERGVELRQGPVGVHLRHPAGPPGHAPGAGRDGRAAGRLVAGGDRGGRGGPGRRARPGRAC